MFDSVCGGVSAFPSMNYAASLSETINTFTVCHFGWSRSQVKRCRCGGFICYYSFRAPNDMTINILHSYVISFDFIRQRQRSRRPIVIPLPKQNTCKRTDIPLLIPHSSCDCAPILTFFFIRFVKKMIGIREALIISFHSRKYVRFSFVRLLSPPFIRTSRDLIKFLGDAFFSLFFLL